MTDMIYYKNGEETFRISPPTVGTKCPETKLEVKKMTEIEKTKGEIKVLQSKLALLEELDRVKSPAEEAFKRVYCRYPDKYGSAWDIFEKGYARAQKDYKVGEYEPTPQGPQGPVGPGPGPKGVIVGYEPTPQTPDKIEENLREAFQKVQQTEEWKETQRKIDSKNPPKFLKFELGQSLTDLIYDWWEDVFTKNSNDDIENCIGRLVYWIEEWLPKEQSAAGSQNVDVEFLGLY
jgi:hypothetical protein